MPEVLCDTSLWIRLLDGDPHARDAFERHADATLVTHPIVLAELAAATLKGRTRNSTTLDEVEKLCRYEPLTRDDALAAAALHVKLRASGRAKLGLADCLVYASARRIGATLLTSDTDLRKQTGVEVVEPPREKTGKT